MNPKIALSVSALLVAAVCGVGVGGRERRLPQVPPAPGATVLDSHGHGDDHDHAHEKETPATKKAAAPGHDDHAHGTGGHEAEGHADEVKLSAEAIRQNGVVVGAAQLRKPTRLLEAPATLIFDPTRVSHVVSPLDGVVIDLLTKPGAVLKAGDPIVRLRSSAFANAQSLYLERQTALKLAEAATEPLKQAYERAQALYDETGGISQGEVLRRQTEWRASTGATRSTQAALKSAASPLLALGFDDKSLAELTATSEIRSTYELRAPRSGTVVRLHTHVGARVAGDAEDADSADTAGAIATLADLSSLQAVVHLPQESIATVRPGAHVTLSGVGGQTTAGTLERIDAELDPRSRTGVGRVVVPNADGRLAAGMVMMARLDLANSGGEAGAEPPEVIMVPESAVLTVEGGPAVFVPVPGEAGTFAKQAVQVGPTSGGWTVVTGGLEAGQQVVTGGAFILKAELGKAGAAHEH